MAAGAGIRASFIYCVHPKCAYELSFTDCSAESLSLSRIAVLCIFAPNTASSSLSLGPSPKLPLPSPRTRRDLRAVAVRLAGGRSNDDSNAKCHLFRALLSVYPSVVLATCLHDNWAALFLNPIALSLLCLELFVRTTFVNFTSVICRGASLHLTAAPGAPAAIPPPGP